MSNADIYCQMIAVFPVLRENLQYYLRKMTNRSAKISQVDMEEPGVILLF